MSTLSPEAGPGGGFGRLTGEVDPSLTDLIGRALTDALGMSASSGVAQRCEEEPVVVVRRSRARVAARRARRRAHWFSLANVVVALVVGEFALVALAAAAQRWFPGTPVVQWIAATTVAAVVGFLAFGPLQIRRWERAAGTPAGGAPEDARAALGARMLDRGGVASFLVGSALGGPPGVAWYWCARNRPHPVRATFAAAWVCGGVWCGVYLGLLGWLGVPAVLALVAVVLVAVAVVGLLRRPIDLRRA